MARLLVWDSFDCRYANVVVANDDEVEIKDVGGPATLTNASGHSIVTGAELN